MDKVPIKTLFGTFFKIGLFTFGGGYAMLSLIEEECVGKHGWMTKEEMLDMVALAESTPGPVAINSATYLGCRLRGWKGAAAATGVLEAAFDVEVRDGKIVTSDGVAFADILRRLSCHLLMDVRRKGDWADADVRQLEETIRRFDAEGHVKVLVR